MTSPVTKPDPSYVRIFDTTLRDGEQSPGATMTSEEKLEVARALSRLGVDVIEAGFPSASPDDFDAVKEVAGAIIARVQGAPRDPPHGQAIPGALAERGRRARPVHERRLRRDPPRPLRSVRRRGPARRHLGAHAGPDRRSRRLPRDALTPRNIFSDA